MAPLYDLAAADSGDGPEFGPTDAMFADTGGGRSSALVHDRRIDCPHEAARSVYDPYPVPGQTRGTGAVLDSWADRDLDVPAFRLRP